MITVWSTEGMVPGEVIEIEMPSGGKPVLAVILKIKDGNRLFVRTLTYTERVKVRWILRLRNVSKLFQTVRSLVQRLLTTKRVQPSSAPE